MLERHNKFLRQSTINLVINSISIKHSLQHFADDDSYIYAFGSKFKLVNLHQTKRASQLGTVLHIDPLSHYNWHATDTKFHSHLPAPCHKIRSSWDPARIDQPCVYLRDYISATRNHARINTPVLCNRQSPTKNQDTWGTCLTTK